MKKLTLSILTLVSTFFLNAQDAIPINYVSDGMKPYVDTFLVVVNQDGWNTSHLDDNDFIVIFSHEVDRDMEGKAGIALGMYDDNQVMVVINTEAWVMLTDYEKQDLINHELMHDVFNMTHTDEDKEFKLMHPSSYPGSWHETIMRLANAIRDLNRKYEASQGDGITDNAKRPAYYNVAPELEPYLSEFVSLARERGIDLSDIYNHSIVIKFIDVKRKDNVASAFKRNRDGIFILVHRQSFSERTEEGRKYVMFHEFGHDILNFPHLEHPERGMMEPTAYTGFFRDYVRFDQERQLKYLTYSLNKMFDRFKGVEEDGICEPKKVRAFLRVWGAGEIETTLIFYDNGDIAVGGFGKYDEYVHFFKVAGYTNPNYPEYRLQIDKKYARRINIIYDGLKAARIYY